MNTHTIEVSNITWTSSDTFTLRVETDQFWATLSGEIGYEGYPGFQRLEHNLPEENLAEYDDNGWTIPEGEWHYCFELMQDEWKKQLRRLAPVDAHLLHEPFENDEESILGWVQMLSTVEGRQYEATLMIYEPAPGCYTEDAQGPITQLTQILNENKDEVVFGTWCNVLPWYFTNACHQYALATFLAADTLRRNGL